MGNGNTNEITFKLIGKVGKVCDTPAGWIKEVNIVAWNGEDAKYDLRDWSPEHDRMTKGITLREEEARSLAKLLTEHFGKMDSSSPLTPSGTTDNL